MTATWLRVAKPAARWRWRSTTRRRLAQVHGVDEEAIAIVVIKTTGDMIQDRALSEAGGKGLFAEGARRGANSRRHRHRRAFGQGFADVPADRAGGRRLPAARGRARRLDFGEISDARRPAARGHRRHGVAATRRHAQAIRPDVAVALLRGNVGTRLDKVRAGEFDATLLALAGLRRLELADRATSVLDTREFLPAVAQGAIGITARVGDAATTAKLAPILHADTTIAVTAERAFLRVLDGSCRTPIGGYATVAGGTLAFRGMVLKPDGSQVFECDAGGSTDQAATIGAAAGHDLLRRMPADLFTTT